MPRILTLTGLAGLRRRAMLSQAELAERVGVHARIVQAWEAGEKYPRPRHQRALVDVLGIQPEQLFAALEESRAGRPGGADTVYYPPVPHQRTA